MAEIIDGKGIAAEVRAEVKAEVTELSRRGVRPGLAAVLVGQDPASRIYVKTKRRACLEAGIHSEIVELPASITQEDLVDRVEALNRDPRFHGILVQQPLPDHISEDEVLAVVDPVKDVDGFHPHNLGRLLTGRPSFVPATPLGIRELLLRSNHPPDGKEVVIIGRSNIVGKPLAALLMQKAPGANATVTLCHSATEGLGDHARRADILVVAIGRPRFIRGDMVKEGAVVIDVGINRVEDARKPKGYRLVGDVAFEEAAKVAGAITPVPGGVGPMTVAMLLKNTVAAAELGIRERF
ncbi:MAG: bifunctional 5,10-methylenetetrahydrofolate dehydrogenase/5,10-methenyltetrahydrofolate cyclohydrolase [Thermoplasmata archaeon]